MSSFALFSDGSFDPTTKIGVGAYLLVPLSYLETSREDIEHHRLVESLRFKEFVETSSTQLEVETSLWALEEVAHKSAKPLRLYTDSQCVAGLLGRRARLEATQFISKKTQQELNHASLYRRFYEFYDKMNFEVIKVAGHQRKTDHDTIQRLFSIVDQEARKALSQARN